MKNILADRFTDKRGNCDIDLDNISFWKATHLIGEVFRRREKGLATYKQLKLLEKFGVPGADKFTMSQAKETIDAIAANGWKTPKLFEAVTV
jgi:hypothetical protein